MPALHELQSAFAAALLSGDMRAVDGWIAGDGAERLAIHRNTMLATFVAALRLSYPAVDALVGSDFFDRAARDFASKHPPKAPLLTLYGSGFADFLGTYAAAASLPYLPDVARLEWAVELAARAPDWDDAPPCATIELGQTRLAVAPSLTLLGTAYPAEPIWRAVLERDDAAIAAIDPGAAPSTAAIWRQDEGAGVAVLGPASCAFLETLIARGDGESAIAAAARLAADGDPIPVIRTEILAAGFVRLTPTA